MINMHSLKSYTPTRNRTYEKTKKVYCIIKSENGRKTEGIFEWRIVKKKDEIPNGKIKMQTKAGKEQK